MNPSEAAALLGVAAAFDNRKPDPDAAQAWALALDAYPFTDCRSAVVEHYRRSREWIMPSDVIEGVKRIRSERLRVFGLIPDPHHLLGDSLAYQRYMAETTRAIADGTLTRENYVPLAAPEVTEADTAAREALMAKVREGIAGHPMDDA